MRQQEAEALAKAAKDTRPKITKKDNPSIWKIYESSITPLYPEATMPLDVDNRHNPFATRSCDLQIGDKLVWRDSSYTGEIFGVTPNGNWNILWSDGGYWNDDSSSVVLATSTTLLKNWPRGGMVLAEESRNAPIDTSDTVKTPKKKGAVDFDTVILAEEKKTQILEAIGQVDNHDLIFNKWGFGDIFEKGTAISLLFYGQPGTGKTLMGQAIADKFGYKLSMVSTAEIETPEPGGAERNIQKYFQEARDGKTVLLFDECDSLIHDRSRVGMIMAAQINALLTALENHKGIVIFTTNRLGTLDMAFERRLSLKLEFPMPDASHRVMIWKRMFPKQAPVAKDVRWSDLAQIEIAGGHIKNVVLKAARKAATTKELMITDEIIWECLENEVESSQAFKSAYDNNNQVYDRVATAAGLERLKNKVAVRG